MRMRFDDFAAAAAAADDPANNPRLVNLSCDADDR